jgi:HEPN domain-containing protein
MGLGMKRVRDLMTRATKDFELAKRHKQVKEYVTATLLYTSAVEKVLKALFISKTKREPPADASIHYLARYTGVPEEVSVYIASMDENEATADPAEISELVESTADRSAESKAFYMEGLVKRLLDYMYAYAK